ncbi:MAG: Ribosomal large subunit pseudouridine synthase, partial [Pseudomonadota bacterium]
LDPAVVPGEVDAAGVEGPILLRAGDARGVRLDRFLADALQERLAGVSRSRIQQWIALGAVECEDRPLSASTKLQGFETIRVTPMPREADHAFEPDPVPIPIVDEDAHLLIVDKPAGLVMHPASGNWRGTLLNGLLFHRPALAKLPRAGIVHRLDRDTSGLLVVAKTEIAFANLTTQLADRSMSRRYLAFVRGVAPEAATVDQPIGRDPRTRVRMAVVDPPAGRPARTHVTRLAQFQLDGQPASLVECRLETGRTHQIRVHMRHLGHPLLGDSTYGGPMGAIDRQALHAWRLGLRDPVTRQPRHWTSLPPADLRQLAERGGLDLAAICGTLDARIGD